MLDCALFIGRIDRVYLLIFISVVKNSSSFLVRIEVMYILISLKISQSYVTTIIIINISNKLSFVIFNSSRRAALTRVVSIAYLYIGCSYGWDINTMFHLISYAKRWNRRKCANQPLLSANLFQNQRYLIDSRAISEILFKC